MFFLFSCRPIEWPFFFGLILPFLVVYLFDWIMFIIIMISICRHTRNKGTLKRSATGGISFRDLRRTVFVTMTLGAVLGLGWGFGLVATSSDVIALTFAFQVIFSIFVGSQGVLIFVFHGLRNEDFRSFWRRHLQNPEFKFKSSFDRSNTEKVSTTVEKPVPLSTLP